MKKFEKFIIPGGEKLLFCNNGPECLFMLYLIIVFNNVLGYSVSKTWTSQQIHGHENFLFDVFELNIIDWQRKIANR